MKRRITIEQLQELTKEQKQNLIKLWKLKEYDLYFYYDETDEPDKKYPVWMHKNCQFFGGGALPLLDIGQMIELLKPYPQINRVRWNFEIEHGELADALWQALKAVL
jgi:hypothetical protein